MNANEKLSVAICFGSSPKLSGLYVHKSKAENNRRNKIKGTGPNMERLRSYDTFRDCSFLNFAKMMQFMSWTSHSPGFFCSLLNVSLQRSCHRLKYYSTMLVHRNYGIKNEFETSFLPKIGMSESSTKLVFTIYTTLLIRRLACEIGLLGHFLYKRVRKQLPNWYHICTLLYKILFSKGTPIYT